jgi:hypothetical protein
MVKNLTQIEGGAMRKSIPIIVVLALLGAVVFLYISFSSQSKKQQEAFATKISEIERKSEEQIAAARQAERSVLSQNRKREDLARISDLEDKLLRLNSQLTAFQQGVDDLFMGSIGQRIASDAALLGRVKSFREDVKSIEDISSGLPAKQDSLVALLQHIRSVDAAVYASSPDTESALSDTASWLRNASSQLESRNLELDRYRRMARDLPDPKLHASLNEAIQKMEEEKKALERKFIVQQEELARKKTVEDMAATRVDEAQKTYEKEMELLKEEMASLRQKLAAESELKKELINAGAMKAQQQAANEVAKAEKNRLRQEMLREEAAIKNYLAPFTTKGVLTANHKTSYDAQPISLAALRSRGALAKTESGIRELHRIAAHGADDMRPRWRLGEQMYALNRWKSSDVEYVKTAQQYLIKYGEVMVEEGWLSP